MKSIKKKTITSIQSPILLNKIGIYTQVHDNFYDFYGFLTQQAKTPIKNNLILLLASLTLISEAHTAEIEQKSNLNQMGAFADLSEFQKKNTQQTLFDLYKIEQQAPDKIYTDSAAADGQFDRKLELQDAQVWLNDTYIKAQTLSFDALTQKIFASSDLKSTEIPNHHNKDQNIDLKTIEDDSIYFKTNDITAKSQSANYDLEAKTGELVDVFYILNQAVTRNTNKKTEQTTQIRTEQDINQNPGHGYAKSLSMPNSDSYYAKEISHSFCPIHDPVWHLNAKSLNIDKRQDRMHVKDAKLVVGNTALVYFPYLDIPLRGQNQSGFLIPEAAINSRTGIDLSVPYYLAISPSYDATITPRILSKRGLQGAGEFRYLLDTMKGKVEADVLIHDWQDKRNRWRYGIEHTQNLSSNSKWLPNATLKIDWQKVSDDSYPQDLGRDINQTTKRLYPQLIELTGSLNHDQLGQGVTEGDWRLWRQHYQTLKPNLAPYNQDIGLEFDQKIDLQKWTQNPALEQSFLKWQHQSIHLNNPELTRNAEATRMVNHISVNKRWQNDSFFSEPSLKLQHISYFGDLMGVDHTPAHKNIFAPTFKWDAGLFLERKIYDQEKNKHSNQNNLTPNNNVNINSNTKPNIKFKTQILEPRLMYSYTPYRSQNSPIFDAAEPEFGFSSLFNEQRYIGYDRLSDQHQLSLSIAFRGINQKAQEDFWLNIGQRYQFNDSKVTLNNISSERLNRGFSDILLQARAMKYKSLSSDFDAQYNPKQSKLIKLNAALNWQPNDDYLANISYRYRKKSDDLNQAALKQLAFETKFKLKNQWNFSTYTSYDLENKRLSQAVAGVEYQHACWKLKLGVDRTITANNQYTTKAIIKISLNGLGS